jgi:predicted esterase
MEVPDLVVESFLRSGEAAGAPGRGRPLLFLVHGYGEPPSMLTDHVDTLDPSRHFDVVTPLAPFHKRGKAIWHRALSGEAEAPVAQFLQSLAALQRCYHRVHEDRGSDPAATVVGGFSQGAGLAVALCVASIGAPIPGPAGCLAFCGFWPPVPELEVGDHPSSRVAGLPLLLTSAHHDPFIPADAAAWSVEMMEGAGFDVTHRDLAGGHEITDEAATVAATWLATVVGRSAPAR